MYIYNSTCIYLNLYSLFVYIKSILSLKSLFCLFLEKIIFAIEFNRRNFTEINQIFINKALAYLRAIREGVTGRKGFETYTSKGQKQLNSFG